VYCTGASTRRHRPGVGRGARSPQPVEKAGWVAAVSARPLPTRKAHAGSRGRLRSAKTHGRAAPRLGVAPRGRPSPGQRSRDSAWACAPLRGRGVWRSQGAAQRGARITRRVTGGAPGGASGSTRWAPTCAETLQGAASGPPCQVSPRAGGVAARVRPLDVRGRGRTRRPWGGRHPLPRSGGRLARRAVGGPATARARERCGLERGSRPAPLRHERCVGGSEGWGLGHRRLCNAGAPASAASAGPSSPVMASRGAPPAPRRAALPSGMAGCAVPAGAPEGLVGPP
jgi:hypothetical protein